MVLCLGTGTFQREFDRNFYSEKLFKDSQRTLFVNMEFLTSKVREFRAHFPRSYLNKVFGLLFQGISAGRNQANSDYRQKNLLHLNNNMRDRMNAVPTFIELQQKLLENNFESLDDKVNAVLFDQFGKSGKVT